MQLDLLVNVVLEEIPDFHHSVVEVVMNLTFWLERPQTLKPFN